MNRFKSFTMLMVLLAAGGFVRRLSAQDDAVVSLTDRTKSFFERLDASVDPKTAFDGLLVEGPLADQSRDADVKDLVDRYNNLSKTYGQLASTPELISVKRIGESLVILKYLYKAEKFPVVWYITYYRPRKLDRLEDGWFVISLRFDTRLELLDLAE